MKHIELSLIDDDRHEAIDYLLVQHPDRITVQVEDGDSWSEPDWEAAFASIARNAREWLAR